MLHRRYLLQILKILSQYPRQDLLPSLLLMRRSSPTPDCYLATASWLVQLQQSESNAAKRYANQRRFLLNIRLLQGCAASKFVEHAPCPSCLLYHRSTRQPSMANCSRAATVDSCMSVLRAVEVGRDQTRSCASCSKRCRPSSLRLFGIYFAVSYGAEKIRWYCRIHQQLDLSWPLRSC